MHWPRKLRSIRPKLLILVLLPMLLMATILLALLFYWMNQVSYRQLLMKASTDLAVAQQRLEATHKQYFNQLVIATQRQSLSQVLQRESRDERQPQTNTLYLALQHQLQQIQRSAELDFIQLIDPQHCLIVAAENCNTFDSQLIDRASNGQSGSAIEVFSTQQLNKISPALARRAVIAYRENATDGNAIKRIESRAMVMHLVYPLYDSNDKLLAIISAGVLINRNRAMVDQIKKTVYSEGSLHSDSLGTVTIFLDGLRISTNVPDAQRAGARAIGTQVSEQVRQKVLLRGERWLDRAFVVDDWYISGYQPIFDSGGSRIGMIYAGFLEAPFREELYLWIWQLVALVLALLLGCAVLVIRGATSIFKPVESMVKVIGNIRSGRRQRIQLNQKTGPELSTLAREFNMMLEQLEQHHDYIEETAEQLEIKVEQRTAALNQHINLLQRTREQLIAKEKLAAIGQLTAGIAHEINNPTAVILGYLDLMSAELKEQGIDKSADVDLMVQQVERIRALINDLLLLSRPHAGVQPSSVLDINALIHATHVLIKHELNAKQCHLQLDLRASKTLRSQRQKLQQVLINLIVNAIAASEPGAAIKIHSRHWKQFIILIISDCGCGMSEQTLTKIFDPFYSQTKGGTGLGLSICYSLLESLDAQISVHSTIGQGSSFCLWLPLQCD